MISKSPVSRRSFFALGIGTVMAGLPLPALAKRAPGPERSIGFYNLHTGESLTTVYWADGQYLPSSLKEIDFILRDFRTGDVTSIAPRLLDLLHALRGTLESQEPFHLISGYRSPKTNRKLAQKSHGVAKKSLHTRGMATDVRLPGRDLDRLRRAAISLQAGGVGYYPKSDFVHVDVGRVRTW